MGNTGYVSGWLPPGLTASYGKMTDLFWGASFVASPLNATSLRDKQGSRDPSAWWQAKFDSVVGHLSQQGAQVLKASAAARALPVLMKAMVVPGTMPNATPQDLVKAGIDQLERFAQDLGVALRTPGADGALRDAVTQLRDASRTVGLGFIAAAATQSLVNEPFDDVFDQLALRDRAGWLHELVGDPPVMYKFGDQDDVQNYTFLATQGFKYVVDIRGEKDLSRSLRRAVDGYAAATKELKANPANADNKRRVTDATAYLASLGNLIASETVNKAMASSARVRIRPSNVV